MDPGRRVDSAYPARTWRGGAFPKRKDVTLEINDNSACPARTGRGGAHPQKMGYTKGSNENIHTCCRKGSVLFHRRGQQTHECPCCATDVVNALSGVTAGNIEYFLVVPATWL